MDIKDILGQAEYDKLKKFSAEEIAWLNERIHVRKDGKPGVECVVRGKNTDGDYFELAPEEIVRQLYAYRLMVKYGYPKEAMSFEVQATYAGHEKILDKRVDITLYHDTDKKKIDLIIEVKRPSVENEHQSDGSSEASPVEQLASYCKQLAAPVGAIVNGGILLKFYRTPNFDEALTIDTFPYYGEDIDDWIEGRRFTLKQLMQEDRLQKETLKDIILAVEQRFGANDSSDKAFDEIFKLIFTKLYDEIQSSKDADEIAILMNKVHQPLTMIDDKEFRELQFRAKDSENADEVFEKIEKLFQRAKKKWPGVFPQDAVLNMQKATVKSCVKELQDVKLFNSNLEVVDDAFEHLVNQNQKGEMGQYFTPRYVIDMCVKMLNPKPNETMIDTAAGSCGFPMHTIFHVWQQMNPKAYNLFTTRTRTPEETEYVQNNVFGIDFSEKSVRVGRMLNIIAGDGHTNVIELNTLDYPKWGKDYLSDKIWLSKYSEGFRRLADMRADKEATGARRYEKFSFDVLMANPPFAGDLNNHEQLAPYQLAYNDKGKLKNKVGRDILFIERNLDFLKPGGRMAVVLPQGRFNNASDQYIRDYIAKRCRILAVVGLHGNVFKPHTGTKTSVLFVQKWTDENCGYPNICPKKEDYPIFFATMQEPSKDNSGDKIYVTENYVRWTKYAYETYEIYRNKETGAQITAEEYNTKIKKSDYKKEIVTATTTEEMKNSTGERDFIKDLFIEQYGALESHQKWVQKKVQFVRKKNAPVGMPAVLSIDEYVALDKDEAKRYKEEPILGKNDNPVLDKATYDALDTKVRKFYLPVETVTEHTERVKDTHGHIFVKHDLFNHDPALKNPNPHNIYSQDGIAEAFIEFAKREKLSFFQ